METARGRVTSLADEYSQENNFAGFLFLSTFSFSRLYYMYGNFNDLTKRIIYIAWEEDDEEKE